MSIGLTLANRKSIGKSSMISLVNHIFYRSVPSSENSKCFSHRNSSLR